MLDLNFQPFPNIQTERLNLRRITEDDLDDMFLLRSNLDAMKHISRPVSVSNSEVLALIQKVEAGINGNTGIVWGICLNQSNRVIGTIGFHRIEKENYRAEIGYMLLPEFWSNGIMSEAIKEVIKHGFNSMNLHSIEANIDPLNSRSKNILLKFGFKKEAYFKENLYFNGKFLDSEIYSLINLN
jgi:ribosomal-protein-alanine N-acetyltransferase